MAGGWGSMSDTPYRLLVAIVQEIDAVGVCDALISAGFPGPTRMSSSGGFLRQANATFMVGVTGERITEALRVIAAACHTRSQYVNPLPPRVAAAEPGGGRPLEVHVGGATVFILDLERYEHW
jgi:uncharacterized protein YaaQ